MIRMCISTTQLTTRHRTDGKRKRIHTSVLFLLGGTRCCFSLEGLCFFQRFMQGNRSLSVFVLPLIFCWVVCSTSGCMDRKLRRGVRQFWEIWPVENSSRSCVLCGCSRQDSGSFLKEHLSPVLSQPTLWVVTWLGTPWAWGISVSTQGCASACFCFQRIRLCAWPAQNMDRLFICPAS